MTLLGADIRDKLAGILRGRSFVVIGMGNRLAGDDGIGAVVAEELERILGRERVWDAGMSLENHLARLVKIIPDVVIIIDSVEMGRSAGEMDIFLLEEARGGIFSHSISPSLLGDILDMIGVKNKVLIGIQPSRVELGEGLSDEVRKAKGILASIFADILKEEMVGNN